MMMMLLGMVSGRMTKVARIRRKLMMNNTADDCSEVVHANKSCSNDAHERKAARLHAKEDTMGIAGFRDELLDVGVEVHGRGGDGRPA